MSREIKRKDMMQWTRDGFKCYVIPYCGAQYLFNDSGRDFYNSGVYGWNCDVFLFYSERVVIATGYRTPACYIDAPSELVREYNGRAERITAEVHDWKPQRAAIEALRDEFISKLKEVTR